MVQMNSQNGDSRTSRTNLGLPVHTAVFKMDNEQGTTAQLWELCSMFCDSLDGRGAWGRMEMCIYIRLSPFAVHLKLSQRGKSDLECWLSLFSRV